MPNSHQVNKHLFQLIHENGRLLIHLCYPSEVLQAVTKGLLTLVLPKKNTIAGVTSMEHRK